MMEEDLQQRLLSAIELFKIFKKDNHLCFEEMFRLSDAAAFFPEFLDYLNEMASSSSEAKADFDIYSPMQELDDFKTKIIRAGIRKIGAKCGFFGAR